MTPVPDVAGYAAAQTRLREQLGIDADFLIKGEPVWPPGTPIDPETGKPYDPFLDPVTPVEETTITVRVSFVHRPLDAADPAASPIGPLDRGNAALIVAEADYPTVHGARRVQVAGEVWDLQSWRHDVAARMPRWIAYLEHA
jgi:hypothetical protein